MPRRTRRTRRLEIEVDRAVPSKIVDMRAIFSEAFQAENPKLAQVMYAGVHPSPAVADILSRHLHSEYSRFMIAYDITKGLVPDPSIVREGEDYNFFDEPMAYGWVSWGIVPNGAALNSYAACDLSVAVIFKLLATEARDRGQDPRQLSTQDPRVRLLNTLTSLSKEGQVKYVGGSCAHLVVNTLALWPEMARGEDLEMARKLLGCVVEFAEDNDWPIWTQVPLGQRRFFREAGFIEMGAFTLNLNVYAPRGGTDWGMQEWIQMVYRPRSR